MMHRTTNIKFIEAKHAKEIYQYKNIKRKLCTINAAIWHKKTCRQKQLIPTYINIRINGRNQQSQRTLRTATQYRINQEIKYLYNKKLKLNKQLYKLHLECADKWPNTRLIILQTTDQKLALKMETHYNNLNRKLDKLQNKQQHKRKTGNNQFYPRTVNLTSTKLTHEEMMLLNNGLQHSIEKPLEKYWTELIMDTELAIRKLDPKMQGPFRILATRKLKQIKASNNQNNIEAKRQSTLKNHHQALNFL
jgi:hypothetical protein